MLICPMSAQKKTVTIGALLAALLGFAAVWSMPVFSGGAVFLALIAIPLALYCGSLGAPRTAAVAIYFSVAAHVPFWVSRDSSFYFGEGYWKLMIGGFVLGFLLLLLWVRKTRSA